MKITEMQFEADVVGAYEACMFAASGTTKKVLTKAPAPSNDGVVTPTPAQ